MHSFKHSSKLLDYLRLYFVLGGMPKVLDLYIQHKNLIDCRVFKTALLNNLS